MLGLRQWNSNLNQIYHIVYNMYVCTSIYTFVKILFLELQISAKFVEAIYIKS